MNSHQRRILLRYCESFLKGINDPNHIDNGYKTLKGINKLRKTTKIKFNRLKGISKVVK
jgi:hypothetical protein